MSQGHSSYSGGYVPPRRQYEQPPSAQQDPFGHLSFYGKKTYRMMHSLHKRVLRRVGALEIGGEERLRSLQQAQTVRENKLLARVTVAEKSVRESEARMAARVAELKTKLETHNKLINARLDEVAKRVATAEADAAARQAASAGASNSVAGSQPGPITAAELQEIRAEHANMNTSLQRQFDELKKTVICRHHQARFVPQPQLPVRAVTPDEQQEGASQSESSSSSDDSYSNTDDEERTAPFASAAERAEFDLDSESLNRQLDLLIAPAPSDKAQFATFKRRVEALMADTPFELLKLRVLTAARDKCIGQAAEWWEEAEEILAKRIETESQAKREQQEPNDEPASSTLPGAQGSAPSAKASSGNTASSSAPNSDGIDSHADTSSASIAADAASATTTESGMAASTSAVIDKVLARIGPFSTGQNYDRWTRRVQAAWDANADAEFRSGLLKGLPRLLRGEPARVVASNGSFAEFDTWDAWKTALYLSLRPAA